MKTTRVMMTADECKWAAHYAQKQADDLQKSLMQDGKLLDDDAIAKLSELLKRRDYFSARETAISEQPDDA